MFKQIIDQVGSHFHSKRVKTTGLIFKLLTRITVNILLCSALVISMKQFFGDPISCQADEKIKSVIETKCWIEGVYIDKKLLFGTIGKDITRYGVGARVVSNARLTKQQIEDNFKQDFIYQNYYQWVVPVLLLQALILYAPRLLWHIWENGLMENLIDRTDSPIIMEGWKKKKSHLIRYMKEVSKKDHRCYFIKYILCEIIGCAALVLNMYIMHWVFNGFWVEYKPAMGALMNQDYTSFSQHSAKLFPTQAKCFYYYFGPSGSTQERDALCFLPQNTINEKIFVFLYVWLISMVVLAALNLARVVLMLTLKCLRISDIRAKANGHYPRPALDFFYYYSDFGYWFTLGLLHKNLSPVLFKDLMADLMKSGEKKKFNFLANENTDKTDNVRLNLDDHENEDFA